MTSLVLFKALADMACYYTLAGSLCALFGAPFGALWLSLFLSALALTGSYLLRERQWRRYIPFLPLSALLAGGGPAAALALLPALGYGLWQARAMTYQPDRGQQSEVFSLFWKLLLGLSLGGILYGKGALVSGFTLPCGAFAVACSVVLLRSLRHDPAVCEDRRYQRTNLLAVALLALSALALSSPPFLALCRRGLGAVYLTLLAPALSALLWVMGTALYRLIDLFAALLHPGQKQEHTPMPDFGGGMEQLQELQESAKTWAFWGEVLLALGTVLAVVLTVLLLRRLAQSRTGAQSTPGGSRERRSAAPPPEREGQPRSKEGRAARQVRSQYRKFLRLCRDRGVSLSPGQTSGDIEAMARGKLDGPAAEELRQLYLPARYDGRADPQAAQRARALVEQLKK